MADLSRFRSLSDDEKMLVAIGVLVDGYDACEHLMVHKDNGEELAAVAKSVADLPPPLRMQYLGNVIRTLLESMGS